jgi:hypothetical protein
MMIEISACPFKKGTPGCNNCNGLGGYFAAGVGQWIRCSWCWMIAERKK